MMNLFFFVDWILDAVKWIANLIWTAFNDIWIGTKDVKKAREKDKTFAKITIIFEEGGNIELLDGKKDLSGRFVMPNVLERVWKIKAQLNGGKVFICPSNSPETISVNDLISKLGKDKDIHGNSGEDWTIDTYKVLGSKFFLFLDEVPKRRLYTMMLMSFIFGMFFCLLIINYFMFKIL